MERKQQQPQVVEDTELATKMLGAHVDSKLYWEFKQAAAKRGEQLKDAVAHAARIYIDVAPQQARKEA